MSFLSLINFNPRNQSEAFDEDIETIERVNISKDFIENFIDENENIENLIIRENDQSNKEISYKTIKSEKLDDLYNKIKEYYIRYVLELNNEEYIIDNFRIIHSNILIYSEVINLLDLKSKYDNDTIKIRVSD